MKGIGCTSFLRSEGSLDIMDRRFILGISGNIGAGKTTVVEILARHLGWEFYKEPAEENPYLKPYYEDPSRWGLHSQVYFLTSRFEEERRLSSLDKSYILDRTIYEDGEVFARMALKGDEYKTYLKLYRLAINYLPGPDLIIYLKAPIDVLIDRIKKRGREGESRISYQYLSTLDSLYENWIRTFKRAPIVIYNIERDINERAEFIRLLNFIEERLKNKL
jgi:deoxyadenosine/deoxycytidine kinase